MLSKNKLLDILTILTIVLFFGVFAMVLFYAPMEVNMGLVQKVFYFHMASAWIGMLAFLVAAVAGVLYLVHRNLHYDYLGASSVEIGLVFTAVANFSGMIWAKPIWNTWWTWDPRLTTMTIMAFTYIAYLLLRRAMDDPARRAQFGAIYAIVGFATVPLTFFSSRLMRTIHPTIFGSGETDMAMNAPMYQTMAAAVVMFTLLFVVILWHRVRLMAARQHLAELQAARDEAFDGGGQHA